MLFDVLSHSSKRSSFFQWALISNVNKRTTIIQRLYSSSASQNQVIFSGIQPTGVPHLGNHLGALQQWVRLQNEAPHSTKFLYSIVDLHAVTVRQDADRLRRWKRETLATLLAVGLDPERSFIFYQSDVRFVLFHVAGVWREMSVDVAKVPDHTELMWLLSCTASVGYLSRMTQWKVSQ